MYDVYEDEESIKLALLLKINFHALIRRTYIDKGTWTSLECAEGAFVFPKNNPLLSKANALSCNYNIHYFVFT